MTRTEEVNRHLPERHGQVPVPEVQQAQALREIAITLAMMYDLMKDEKEGKDDSNTD